jgi:hypothetical protein
VNVAPRSLGMNGLLSFARVRHNCSVYQAKAFGQEIPIQGIVIEAGALLGRCFTTFLLSPSPTVIS